MTFACAAAWAQASGWRVDSVSWSGVTDPSAQALLQGRGQSLQGKTLDDAGLDREAEAATEVLRQSGYPVARVLVPAAAREQWHRDGRLQFAVFEGKVGAVEVRNTSNVDSARVQRVAQAALCATSVGDDCVLKTGRLERATQLLQDIPGVKLAGVSFSPEGVGVGQTKVVFQTEASVRKLTGMVSADNYGIASTGLNRLWFSGSANNLLGMGEVVDLTLGTTNRHQNTGRLGLSAPLGDGGWRWTASAARSNYAVTSAGIELSGYANTGTLGLSYPILRGLDRNLVIAIDAMTVRSEVRADDFGITISSKRLSALKFSLLGNSGDRAMQTGDNLWSYGVSLLGGRVRNDQGSDPAGVDGSYWKLAGNLLRRQNLSGEGRWYLLANVRGQVANRNLDPYEKLPLGGPFGVRAFRADEGSVDDGGLVSAELRYRLPSIGSAQMSPGLFVDAAMGRVNHSAFSGWQTYQGYADPSLSNTRRLYGYGVLFDLRWNDTIVAGLAWSRRFGFSDDSVNHPGSARGRLWATLSARF